MPYKNLIYNNLTEVFNPSVGDYSSVNLKTLDEARKYLCITAVNNNDVSILYQPTIDESEDSYKVNEFCAVFLNDLSSFYLIGPDHKNKFRCRIFKLHDIKDENCFFEKTEFGAPTNRQSNKINVTDAISKISSNFIKFDNTKKNQVYDEKKIEKSFLNFVIFAIKDMNRRDPDTIELINIFERIYLENNISSIEIENNTSSIEVRNNTSSRDILPKKKIKI